MILTKVGSIDPEFEKALRVKLAAEQPPESQVEEPNPRVKESYDIPDRNMGWLTQKIKKMNNRVEIINAKMKDFSGEPLKPITFQVLEDIHIKGTRGTLIPGKRVVVKGEVPRVKGWEFAGKITPMSSEDGSQMNLISRNPSFEQEIPMEYRTSVPKCEACNEVRRRKDTFLVYNADRKEFKEIGRNCLAKFFGGPGPEDLAFFSEELAELFQAMEAFEGGDDEGGGYGHESLVPIGTFVATAIAMIRTFGWVSRKKANEEFGGESSTATLVWDYFTSEQLRNKILEKAKNKAIPLEVREEDIELAKKAIEWARNVGKQATEALDDFMWNLAAASTPDVVNNRTAGILAYLSTAYAKANKTTDFSQQGQALLVQARVEAKRPTRFGSIMVKMRDANKKAYVWFAKQGQEPDPDFINEGDSVQFEGLLQKVTSYQGEEQIQVAIKRFLSSEEFFGVQKETAEKQEKLQAEKADLPPLVADAKLRLDLTVVDARSFTGESYGRGPAATIQIYRLMDQYGRKFFYKTTDDLELKIGNTYTCDAVVAFAKHPGSNKALLTPDGKRQLAFDKNDPQSVRLKSLVPLAVEGKTIFDPEEMKAKLKQYKALEKKIQKEDEAAEEMEKKINALSESTIVRVTAPSFKPKMMPTEEIEKEKQEVVRLIGEATKSVQAGADDYNPQSEILNFRDLFAKLRSRPMTNKEALAKFEEEKSLVNSAAPEIQSLISELNRIDSTYAQSPRGYSEDEIAKRKQIEQDVQAHMAQLEPKIKDTGKRYHIGDMASFYSHSRSIGENIRNMRSRLEGAIKWELQRIGWGEAIAKQGGPDEPHRSHHNELIQPVPLKVPPQTVVDLLRQTYTNAEIAEREIPPLIQQKEAAEANLEALNAELRSLSDQMSEMKQRSQRGQAREAARNWIRNNCSFFKTT